MNSRWDFKYNEETNKLFATPKPEEMQDYVTRCSAELQRRIMEHESRLILQGLTKSALLNLRKQIDNILKKLE